MLTLPVLHGQELDDQALEVMQAAKAAEELLARKAAALAGIRAEHERKQKEARALFWLLVVLADARSGETTIPACAC